MTQTDGQNSSEQTRVQEEMERQLAAESAGGHADHDHPDFLQHHFDTPEQQFEAAKLGMWLFLATEILLFGGLFCLYALLRGMHPELFLYGSQFLSTKMGAINTVVLILSSLTIALSINFLQRGWQNGAIIMLALTLLGGGIFMGIKYVEYTDKFKKKLYPGAGFYQVPDSALAEQAEKQAADAAAALTAGDPSIGRELWMATCLACHGVAGEGVQGQAFDIRGSEFIAERTDAELLAYIKVGRMPFDPLNTTGIQMPPKGGNPMLSDDDLMHIIAYIRSFELPAEGQAVAHQDDGVDAQDPNAMLAAGMTPRSVIPVAPEGPRGLDLDRLEGRSSGTADPAVDPRLDPTRPKNLHMFFNIYYLMTGLHAFHVIFGMAVIAWLIVLTMMGRFSPAYYTPVEMGGLYWHVVDIIWIFLFPLLYLIH